MEITNGIYTAEDVAFKLGGSIKVGTGWNCFCPAHDNKNTQALSVNDKDGKIVIFCHAGCKQLDVIEALKERGAWPEYRQTVANNKNTKTPLKITHEYNYTDQEGNLAYVVCRCEPKTFLQKRPHEDGSWIWGLNEGDYAKNSSGDWSKRKGGTHIDALSTYYPYKLSNLINHPDLSVFLCEGEKDADNVINLKLLATTFAGGSKGWRDEYLQWFEGRRVYILQDNDSAGRAGAEIRAEHISKVAAQCKIIELPQNGEKKVKDISDWIQNGGTKQQLADLVKATPIYEHRGKTLILADPVFGNVVTAPIDTNVGFIEWVHIDSKGKPLATIENAKMLLNAYQVAVRYNATKKEIDVNIPGRGWLVDNAANCALAEITSLAVRHRLAEGRIKQYLIAIADEHRFNPFVNWILSKPWDGKQRIELLFHSLDAQGNKDLGLKMLRKWLLSGIEANFNPLGVSNSSVLVLQGAQYAGKTSWFWELVGGSRDLGKEACILNPSDKDSVMQAVSYAITELGELDATFRRADIAALKGFITKNFDQLRKPYAEADSKFPRRTIFLATVNLKEIFHDETNRRFWTIECGTGLTARHGLDMQQVWAEAKHLWDAKESYLMTRDEVKELNSHNLAYTAISVIEEMITTFFDFDAHVSRWKDSTATDVLMLCDYKNPSAKDRANASQALAKLCGEGEFKYGRRTYKVPPRKNSPISRNDYVD